MEGFGSFHENTQGLNVEARNQIWAKYLWKQLYLAQCDRAEAKTMYDTVRLMLLYHPSGAGHCGKSHGVIMCVTWDVFFPSFAFEV